ncbi:hypothetical protein IW261DRAFT_1424482 [Armillaria novae-zelandiae]|uniref:Uncharacterized protein n=1 Tax=Armillaria novae-zelandiae TaxID=153914 RepID=A0AA39UB52_9AGAR|nr:hypothetical protein IW261DRAFT_1424482 [Armillaria novae-zelandiae]
MKSLPQWDVTKWTELVEAWEVDRMKPNPFNRTIAIPLDKTEVMMHLQLAQEDAQDELTGLDGNELHTTSPKDMISQGIQLEASHQLLTLSKAYKDGDTNVLIQKEQLKCHKVMQDLNAHITQAKQYYCDIRKGLMVLLEVLVVWSWQKGIMRCPGSGILYIWEMFPVVLKNVCELNGASTPMGGTLFNAGEGVAVYAKQQAST